jgi:hypothetical protein
LIGKHYVKIQMNFYGQNDDFFYFIIKK